MFALRGLAVSFSIFFVLYTAASLAVTLLWRAVLRSTRGFSSRRQANTLFLLRILPFLIAAAATLSLAIPSFWLLEPRSVEESLGIPPVLFSFGAISTLLLGFFNAVIALKRTSRTIAGWSGEASSLGTMTFHSPQSVTVMRASAAAPPLTAVGIFRPQVWLSSTAEFLLTESELRTALRHEIAHVKRRDNLRKLILRTLAFPGMAPLEAAWREHTEMAADDAAVSSASEALDLAAAVIKLSRLAPHSSPMELTTALVHTSAESLNLRVERLLAWSDASPAQSHSASRANRIAALLLGLTCLAVLYPALLVWTHAATEWLIR